MDNSVKNKYEHLRMQGFDDDTERNEFRVQRVYRSGVENIDVFTADVAPGRVALGYNIWFANGRNVMRKPMAEAGVFRTDSDALLWFLGYITAHGKYFTADALAEVRRQSLKLEQGSLF